MRRGRALRNKLAKEFNLAGGDPLFGAKLVARQLVLHRRVAKENELPFDSFYKLAAGVLNLNVGFVLRLNALDNPWPVVAHRVPSRGSRSAWNDGRSIGWRPGRVRG